ncbi:MAG: hypothetical protein QOJ23_3652, partial [Actinomycetota bacterium]|nr:hypothetical protein [Actinomycetota bacterium]
MALAVVVTVTAGVVVYRGVGSPKVEVTAGHRPSAGDYEAPPSVDETTSSTEAATTSSTGRSAPGSTATTATMHRVQAPTSSTTATTHRATTTTTAGPTTTTTAPAADPHAPVDFAPKSDGTGGWLLRREGSVTALGSAQPLGDAAGRIHDDAASRFHNEAVGIAT